MEEDYLENNQSTPGPSNNVKPKSENNVLKEIIWANTRTQLFQDMEAGDPGQDDNITIMTSNLSLGTSAPKEPESCVKVRMPSPIPEQFSHQNPERFQD